MIEEEDPGEKLTLETCMQLAYRVFPAQRDHSDHWFTRLIGCHGRKQASTVI